MTNYAVGLFQTPASALAAAGTLKGAGFTTPELMSQVPLEGAEEALDEKKSAITYLTMFGGLIGG